MMYHTYTQTAEGNFSTYLRPLTPHCGFVTATWPRTATFKYSITIEAGRLADDRNGYMLDNTWFRGYFDAFRHAQVSISCERLAEMIAGDILRAYGAPVSRIVVKLVAVEGTSVACEYRGDSAPLAAQLGSSMIMAEV